MYDAVKELIKSSGKAGKKASFPPSFSAKKAIAYPYVVGKAVGAVVESYSFSQVEAGLGEGGGGAGRRLGKS